MISPHATILLYAWSWHLSTRVKNQRPVAVCKDSPSNFYWNWLLLVVFPNWITAPTVQLTVSEWLDCWELQAVDVGRAAALVLIGSIFVARALAAKSCVCVCAQVQSCEMQANLEWIVGTAKPPCGKVRTIRKSHMDNHIIREACQPMSKREEGWR